MYTTTPKIVLNACFPPEPGISAPATHAYPRLTHNASPMPSIALPSRLRDRLVQNRQQGQSSGSILPRAAQVFGGQVLPRLSSKTCPMSPDAMAGWLNEPHRGPGQPYARLDLGLPDERACDLLAVRRALAGSRSSRNSSTSCTGCPSSLTNSLARRLMSTSSPSTTTRLMSASFHFLTAPGSEFIWQPDGQAR